MKPVALRTVDTYLKNNSFIGSMPEAISPEVVMSELKSIKEELDFIKKHMVDVDSLLIGDEEARLEESLKEYREGKAVSLEEFEKGKQDA